MSFVELNLIKNGGSTHVNLDRVCELRRHKNEDDGGEYTYLFFSDEEYIKVEELPEEIFSKSKIK